jgi:hypothetical protein
VVVVSLAVVVVSLFTSIVVAVVELFALSAVAGTEAQRGEEEEVVVDAAVDEESTVLATVDLVGVV